MAIVHLLRVQVTEELGIRSTDERCVERREPMSKDLVVDRTASTAHQEELEPNGIGHNRVVTGYGFEFDCRLFRGWV